MWLRLRTCALVWEEAVALSRSRRSSLCSVRCCGSHSPPQSRCLSSVLSVFLFGVLRPTQLYFYVHKLLHFIDNTVVNKNNSLWAPFFSVWFDLHSLIKLFFGCFLFKKCLFASSSSSSVLFHPPLRCSVHVSSQADSLTGMAWLFLSSSVD